MGLTDADRKAGSAANAAKAKARAVELAPIIQELQGQGLTLLSEIARALNDRSIPAPKSGVWTAIKVSRVIARLP
jgi:hypothetical protein